MTPQQAKLLPCPFCGSTHIDAKGWSGEGDKSGPGCDDCGALAETVEDWNRRAPAPTEPAVDRDAVAGSVSMLVPKWAGQFDTFQDWVNMAQSRLASPEHRRAICVDAKGRRCTIGKDMQLARDEGAFPVRYFWECELVEPVCGPTIDRNSVLEEAAALFSQPHMEYFGDAIQLALRSLKSSPVPDPCPQCERGGVCKSITCGRLRSSELMALYGTFAATPASPAMPSYDIETLTLRGLAADLVHLTEFSIEWRAPIVEGDRATAISTIAAIKRILKRDPAPQVAQASQWKWAGFEDWLASPITPPVNQVEYVRLAFNAGREQASQPTSAEGMTAWAAYCPAGFQFIHADQRVVEDFVYTRRYCGEGPYSIMHMKVSRPTSAEGKDSEPIDAEMLCLLMREAQVINERAWVRLLNGDTVPFTLPELVEIVHASTGKDTDKEATK